MKTLGWGVTLLLVVCTAIQAQTPANMPVAPSQILTVQATTPQTDATPPGTTQLQLEERIRSLEAQNMEQQRELDELISRNSQALNTLTRPASPIREQPLSPLPAQLGRPLPPGRDIIQTGDEILPRSRVDLEQGIRFLSPEGRFRLELHNLTQFDGRFYSPSGAPLVNNFDIPRQRLYFAGVVDEKFEFYTVLNRGYGSLDVLDSYAGYRYSKEVNFRLGRMKNPFGYEYYKTAEGDLIAPERSVFVGNLSPNRQIGAMFTGRLANERIEYAVGVFNGPQRSFQDYNNFKNPIAYVNAKPFLQTGVDLIRNMNFGGAITYGKENDPQEPNGFRTANDETIASSIDSISPTFLRFNDGVTVLGEKALWLGDFNWYFRSLTAQAQYNGGYINYALNDKKTRVAYTGYSFAMTYFITGEEIITRKEVKPLRDWDIRTPFSSPGAIEVFGRVANLNAGPQIFDAGLADSNLWSRSAIVTDVGTHWYPNRYIRITFDYQLGQFSKPIQIAPNRMTNTTNMFWLRTQLFY